MKSVVRVVASFLGITILGVLVTVLVVWVYSTFVAPGMPTSNYQAFANTAGPWVSIFAGPLITFGVVRTATRRLVSALARRETVWVMGLYFALDIAVLVASNPAPVVWVFAAVSILGRSAGAWLALRPKLSWKPQ